MKMLFTLTAAILLILPMSCTQQAEESSDNSGSNLSEASPIDNDFSDQTKDEKYSDETYAKLFLANSYSHDAQNSVIDADDFDEDDFDDALDDVDEYDKEYEEALRKRILVVVRDMIFDSADIDESGFLSEDEYLSFQIGHWEPTEDLEEDMQEWKEKSFELASGDDEELDKEELLAILIVLRKDMRKRYIRRGGIIKLAKEVKRQLIHNFDENGNGRLDPEERDKVRDAVKDEHARYHNKVAEQCTLGTESTPICRLDLALKEMCEIANKKDRTFLVLACDRFFEKPVVEEEDEDDD